MYRIPVAIPQPVDIIATQPLGVVPAAVPTTLFTYNGKFNLTPQYTVPDHELNVIQWVWMQYTTTASGTPRSIRLIITTDGAVEVARHIARSPQFPGTGISYYWMPGCPYQSPADGCTTQYIPTAALLLPPKWTIAMGDFLRVDDNDTRTMAIVGTRIPITS